MYVPMAIVLSVFFVLYLTNKLRHCTHWAVNAPASWLIEHGYKYHILDCKEGFASTKNVYDGTLFVAGKLGKTLKVGDDTKRIAKEAFKNCEKIETVAFPASLLEIQDYFSKIDFRINRRPGKLPPVFDNTIDWERYIENRKSSVRCKVEHAFRIIKCQFGYKKTVYKGLKKNENRLYAMFACANLYALAMAKRKLSTV